MIKKHMLSILSEAANAEKRDATHDFEYDDYESNITLNNDGEASGDTSSNNANDDEDEDCSVDDDDLEDISDEDMEQLKNDIIASYNDMDSVDNTDLNYTAEMVTVIASKDGEYLVECDNLAKLMNSEKCDGYTAMQKISEANNIPLAEMKLVVESNDAIISLLNEKAVSRKTRKKKTLDMKSSAIFLQDIKNKGITVLKKKSRKKKSKKK